MQKQSGFTFVEVMVSMLIMGFALIAGFSFFVRAMRLTYNYSEYAHNLDFAVSNVELARQMAVNVCERQSYPSLDGKGFVAYKWGNVACSKGAGIAADRDNLDRSLSETWYVSVWPLTQVKINALGIGMGDSVGYDTSYANFKTLLNTNGLLNNASVQIIELRTRKSKRVIATGPYLANFD